MRAWFIKKVKLVYIISLIISKMHYVSWIYIKLISDGNVERRKRGASHEISESPPTNP